MPDKIKAPAIRFAGYTDDWEQRKLSDVTTRIVRKNKDLESTLPLTISSIYGLVDQITYFNNRVASRDVSNYYLIKRGEFAYNKSYSDGYPWGSVKRLDRYEMGVLSTLYIVFALDTGVVDSDFLVSYYETDYWHKKVAVRAAEGARNHGLLNISADDFFDTALRFPKDIAEQTKIGEFFIALDNLITLHQREYDKTVNVKKAMLEKMFPKEGENKPEIRFAGFTDAWEQRRLGELMEITSVKRIHQSDWTNSGVRFLRARDVVSAAKGEEPADYLYISEEKYDEYSKISGKVQVGDLLVTGVGSIGVPMLIDHEKPLYFKDGNIIWFKNQNIIDGNFFYYSFISGDIQKYIRDVAGTGTVGTYTIDSGKKTPISFPKFEEQKKIGQFFGSLDILITLHQRELDKLQNMKKALLEKMFI